MPTAMFWSLLYYDVAEAPLYASASFQPSLGLRLRHYDTSFRHYFRHSIKRRHAA